MELVVVGLSHRTAPIGLRERLVFSRAEAEETLKGTNSLHAGAERLLLSTCNRTELYLLAEGVDVGRDSFLDLVRRQRGIDLVQHPGALYVHSGPEMVGHLFRVASSIDSMIVGEAQILGQVHEAFEIARRAGTAGPMMHRLLEAAFRVGKRVRSETDISVGAVSVSYAAVTLATRIFSDLSERTALLVGSGETGELAARHLKEEGVSKLLVTNRTHEKAVELAAALDATAVPFDEIEKAISAASILITATASPVPLIRHDMVRRAVSARGNRPLLVIDIAVPRDVEPAVRDLQNVFLYDIDALEGLVHQNLERRKREIPKVESIIQQELDQFLRWYGSLEAVPVIRELRERFEEVRSAELERFAPRFCEKDREQIDSLTRGIINKLLHEPSVAIRGFQRHGADSLIKLETVRQLFGLKRFEKDRRDGEETGHARN